MSSPAHPAAFVVDDEHESSRGLEAELQAQKERTRGAPLHDIPLPKNPLYRPLGPLLVLSQYLHRVDPFCVPLANLKDPPEASSAYASEQVEVGEVDGPVRVIDVVAKLEVNLSAGFGQRAARA